MIILNNKQQEQFQKAVEIISSNIDKIDVNSVDIENIKIDNFFNPDILEDYNSDFVEKFLAKFKD